MKIRNLVFAAIFISIGLCLSAPYWLDKKFPYEGTWVFQRDGGKTLDVSLTFDHAGNCFINYSTGNGSYVQRNIPTHYSMMGTSAIAYCDFTRPFDPKRNESQPIHWKFKTRLTPLNGGKILRHEILELVLSQRNRDKIWHETLTQFGTKTIYLNKK